jgi:hypothetical protein
VTLASSAESFSFSEGSIAPGAQVLAEQVGDSNRKTMIAVEQGAQLLDGGAAAAKRLQLFLYDTTWLVTNSTGRLIFENSVSWALGDINADFSADVVSGTAPLTVSFNDTTTGPATSWDWTFGDGTSSGQRNPSHVYTAPGTYSVSLTASGIGASDSRTRVAYINVQASSADFDADGDVDADDCNHLRNCVSGDSIAPTAYCVDADLDSDGDVDQADFGRLQREMTAPVE